MKKMMNKTVRATVVAIIATVLFAGTAMASEKAVGTIEKTAEFRAEALAEKALATKTVEIENNEVENFESQVTFEDFEIEVVEIANEVAEEVKAEVKEEAIEEVEEEIAEVETAAEFVEEDEADMVAEIANTADGAALNTEVKTIDAATAATSADGVVVEFGNTAVTTTTTTTTTTAKAAATTTTATTATKKVSTDVNAKYLGTTAGTKKAITLIGDSTFRDVTKLQAAIDANNIICYPTADMTKGVKYMAGHNPGAMSHVAGLKVGSIVRLSNDGTYQDYQIKEIKQGSGSFASITFNTTKGVMDAWTMLKAGTENAVIIQYCIHGVNTLHYGVAI